MGEERARFGFGAALIASAVLHLVLVVVVWLIPTRAPTEAAVVQETRLRFDLTAVQPTAQTIEPRGQVPFRTPARSQEARPPSDPGPAGPSSSPPPPSPPLEQPETDIEAEEREGPDVPGSAIDEKCETTRSSVGSSAGV